MNVIVNEDNVIGVMSDLYRTGARTEDGQEIIGTVFYLVLETDSGERLSHNHSFLNIERETVDTGEELLEMWVQTDAEERAERLADRIRQVGTINTENWSYMEPRYGSAAYVDQHIEELQVQREKMAA